MFCPLCEAEFDRVIARCPNCGATLVATKDEAARAGPRSALWQGDHPNFNARLVEKLTEAQITHLAAKRTERIRNQWSLAGPLFQVYVLNSDLDQAKEVLRTVSGEFVVDDSAAIGIIGAIGIENTGAPQASGEWRDEDQSVEVWSGDDTSLADFLRESLRTNEIDFRTRSDSGKFQRLEVRPADQSRAREIVREVMECTPPE
jgi:hypothetical protein